MNGDLLDTSSLEAIHESAERLFSRGGPGRQTLDCSDEQIVDLLLATGRLGWRLPADGALFVIPCPAGVIGVRRAAKAPAVDAGVAAQHTADTIEPLLPEGRHYRGWRWSPGPELNHGSLPWRIAESFR